MFAAICASVALPAPRFDSWNRTPRYVPSMRIRNEIGFHAVEDRHYVTDVHATILHQLGLDSRKLEVPGRKRLDIDHGKPIREILA